jgi:hypothetical protein
VTIAIICAIIGMAILAGLSRVADMTGAAVRDKDEQLFNWHEVCLRNGWLHASEFYAQRKWEVKAD